MELPVGTTAAPLERSARSELALGLGNAIKLFASLVVTWGIGLGMRLYLPRKLGPEAFGALNYAEALTMVAFLALSLGLETYARKEVSVRPAHASDFFGGTLALRALLSLAAFALLGVFLHFTGRPAELRTLAYLLGGMQALVILGGTYTAFLHSVGRVDGLSLVSIAAKLLWAAWLVAALLVGAPLWVLGLGYLVTEAFRAVILHVLCKRHLQLETRIDVPGTRTALVASLPFFVNGVAAALYGKLDVNLLGLLVSDRELGYYAAAQTLAGLSLLLAPLLTSVLTPMLARAAARDEAELYRLLSRALEYALVWSVSIALALALEAELWLRALFGVAFVPGKLALALVAPTLVLTYVATLASTALILLGRGWRVTVINVVTLVLNAALGLLLIRPLQHALDRPGSGGAGAALALLAAELLTAGWLLQVLGRAVLPARVLRTALGLAAACVAAIVSHHLTGRLGDVRLLTDAAVYLAVVLGTRTLRPSEVLSFVRSAQSARRETA